MAEHEGKSFREFAIQSAVVLSILAGTGVVGVVLNNNNSETNNDPAQALDGGPALPSGSPTASTEATTSGQTNPISDESTPHTLHLGVPPNCIPTPPGYITSQSNCAIYELKPHPTEPGKLCAEKGSHDPDNERTLYGMGFAVSDALQYPIVIVDPATNQIIGYFASGVSPTFEDMYFPATNESLACLYYGGPTSGMLESSIDQ